MPDYDNINSGINTPTNECPSPEINQSVTANADTTQETQNMDYYSPYDAPQYQKAAQPVPPKPFQPPYQPPFSSSMNFSYNQRQPYFMPPYYQPMTPQRQAGEGISIASLVLGILSLIFVFAPFINILLSLTALILGIIAKIKGNRGMAIAGIILGTIGIILSVLLLLFLFTSVFNSFNSFDNSFSDGFNKYTALTYLH